MQNEVLNIDLFEQIFNEKILKRGLSLFHKSEIIDVEKQSGGEFIFSFKDVVLKLKKRANKIYSFKCLCRDDYCEHLCAAMFYLSDEKLQIKKSISLKGKKLKGHETVFASLCMKIKASKNTYSGLVEENPILAIRLFEQQNKGNGRLMISLAIINVLSENYFYAKTLNLASERNILHFAADKCLKYLKKKLSSSQKETLILLVKNILGNNRKFNSGVFAPLLPYALQYIKSRSEFKEIKSLLNKRRLKYNYQQYLNIQKIAIHQVHIKESEFLNDELDRNAEVSTEYSLAKAELMFAEKKPSHAFKSLIKDNQKIQKTPTYNYISYLDYIILKCREHGKTELEAEFLKINFLYDPIISEEKWLRLNGLFDSENGKNEFIKTLVAKFKKQPDLYFEKLAVILESEKMYDELIVEINKHSNKYFLLNRIVIKKLPAYDDFTFKVYVKQFDNILYEARESFHQAEIFNRLKLYIEKLPERAASKLVFQLLDKVSRNNFIYSALKDYSEKFTEAIPNLPKEK